MLRDHLMTSQLSEEVGLGGVFWRRAPWRHERRGEVEASTGVLKCGVCRMITLGQTDFK